MNVCTPCLRATFTTGPSGHTTVGRCIVCEHDRIACNIIPAQFLTPTPAAITRMGAQPAHWLQAIINTGEERMPAPNTTPTPAPAPREPTPEPVAPSVAAAAQLAAQGEAGTASEAHDRSESHDDVLRRLLRGEMKKATPTIYVSLQAHDGALTQWRAYVHQRAGILELTLPDDVDMVEHEGRLTWAVRLYNPNSRPELEVAAMIATKAGVDRERIAQIEAVVL